MSSIEVPESYSMEKGTLINSKITDTIWHRTVRIRNNDCFTFIVQVRNMTESCTIIQLNVFTYLRFTNKTLKSQKDALKP